MDRAGERREEIYGQRTNCKIMSRGAISVVGVLITGVGDVKRSRQPRPSEARYVRPPRRCELARCAHGMCHCVSDECHLRPTVHCNHHAAEVVALAIALEAYRMPDREFAQAALQFPK